MKFICGLIKYPDYDFIMNQILPIISIVFSIFEP